MTSGVYKRTKPGWNKDLTKETDERVRKNGEALKGIKKPKRTKQHCEKLSKANTTHGGTGTRLYKTWKNIRNRCRDKNSKAYGGKGIQVCPEWRNDFVTFRNWALSHGYNDNLVIHRKKDHLNYSPENCEWIDRSEHARYHALENGLGKNE